MKHSSTNSVTIYEPDKINVALINQALQCGSKLGIQRTLEHLAQIKPIGKDDTRQQMRVGYLVYDLIQEGISEAIVEILAKRYRKDKDQIFFPDHGKFLEDAKAEKLKFEAIAESKISDPEARTKKTRELDEFDFLNAGHEEKIEYLGKMEMNERLPFLRRKGVRERDIVPLLRLVGNS